MGEVIAMCWKDVLKRDGCGCTTQKQDKGEEFEKKKTSKPDYIDLDGDGNRKESMKQAAKDKKKRPKPKNPFTRKD